MEKINFIKSCSFTYIMVEASDVCRQDGRKDVLLVVLCVVIRKTISVRTERHVTLDTSQHRRSRHRLSLNTRDIAVAWDSDQSLL